MRRNPMFVGAVCLFSALNTAQAVEIRFYPSKQIYAYELDATRGIRSVVLQNVAIVNDGTTETAISQVDIELIAGNVAYETRSVRTSDLDRIAKAGAQLQGAGMLTALKFQFGGRDLVPDGIALSTTRTLKAREALLLTHQVLAFSGKRDALRVRVQTAAGASEATLPISTERSRTVFALPFQGMWHDGAGPSLHSHHRWAVPQEFAHDFTRIGTDGLPYRGDGTRLSDYYAYGQPVLAAAAGEIAVALSDELEDASLLQRAGETQLDYLKRIVTRQNEQILRGARGIVGNHILIRHGEEYSLYAHLKPGSIKVKAGDKVTKGQQIASVGSSGSSTEPHLHFHVCDTADVLVCAGVPAQFEDVEIYGALEPRQPQSGDLVRNRAKAR